VNITVDIAPEVRDELVRRAAPQGRMVEAYAASLLEDSIHLPATARTNTPSKAPAKDMVELFAPLRGLNIDFERDDFERDRDAGRDIEL
jgi:hypothetical protein